MKLIFIYGPPAVGKLTVAKELEKLTSFKVFHNHLSVDLVEAVFQRGTPPFAQLIWDVRLQVFAKAAETGTEGLIFTMVYERGRETLMARSASVVEEKGGEVCFVRLTCSRATLERRVGNEERKRYGKISSADVLDNFLDGGDEKLPFAAAAGWESLTVDTDKVSAAAAAEQITTHYSL